MLFSRDHIPMHNRNISQLSCGRFCAAPLPSTLSVRVTLASDGPAFRGTFSPPVCFGFPLQLGGESAQSQQVTVCRQVAGRAKRVVMLSGTPSLSKPFDLFNQASGIVLFFPQRERPPFPPPSPSNNKIIYQHPRTESTTPTAVLRLWGGGWEKTWQKWAVCSLPPTFLRRCPCSCRSGTCTTFGVGEDLGWISLPGGRR